jgi:hypothetical protein
VALRDLDKLIISSQRENKRVKMKEKTKGEEV